MARGARARTFMTTELDRQSRSGYPQTASRGAQGAPVWADDETEDALQVLKLGGAFGLFFLIAYTAFDLRVNRAGAQHAGTYFVMLGAMCLFYGVTWTRWFRRYWQLWTLLFCLGKKGYYVRNTGEILLSGLNPDRLKDALQPIAGMDSAFPE